MICMDNWSLLFPSSLALLQVFTLKLVQSSLVSNNVSRKVLQESKYKLILSFWCICFRRNVKLLGPYVMKLICSSNTHSLFHQFVIAIVKLMGA